MKKKNNSDYMKQFELSDEDLGKVVAGLGEQIINEDVFGAPTSLSNVECKIGYDTAKAESCPHYVKRNGSSGESNPRCLSCRYGDLDMAYIPDVTF